MLYWTYLICTRWGTVYSLRNFSLILAKCAGGAFCYEERNVINKNQSAFRCTKQRGTILLTLCVYSKKQAFKDDERCSSCNTSNSNSCCPYLSVTHWLYRRMTVVCCVSKTGHGLPPGQFCMTKTGHHLKPTSWTWFKGIAYGSVPEMILDLENNSVRTSPPVKTYRFNHFRSFQFLVSRFER